MNTRILFFLYISTFSILAGCDKDDDSPKVDAIKGVWNLKNVNGGLLGININYTKGEVIWNFNGTGSLIVENNIVTTGPEDIFAGFDSGTYEYEIKTEDHAQILYINHVKRGQIDIASNTLLIDDGLAVDGLLTEFEK